MNNYIRKMTTKTGEMINSIVPRRHNAYGYLLLGVQTNPGSEFKKAIRTAAVWAPTGCVSFDILMFSPTDYHGTPVPLYEHTGFANFIAVYYKNKSGAFPFGEYPIN